MSDIPSPTNPAGTSVQALTDASANRGVKAKTPEKALGCGLGVTFDDSTPGVQRIHLSRNDILCDLFHTKDPAQASALLSHCLKTVRVDETDGDGVTDDRGFMVSVVRDIAPKDVVERMLAVQMATTHVAMIRAARLLAGSNQIPQLEANSTNYNKLARTFTAQVEALRKHRNGGKQSVTVEHVHVHPGAQAIVGEVHHGGEGLR